MDAEGNDFLLAHARCHQRGARVQHQRLEHIARHQVLHALGHGGKTALARRLNPRCLAQRLTHRAPYL
jgi:hypothetical protein